MFVHVLHSFVSCTLALCKDKTFILITTFNYCESKQLFNQ